jgi:branched-chain amino acid aminotransferase
MAFPPGIAFIDGDYCPISEAKISVLDWGFLRSDATYDVVHVWKGRFFRLDTHIQRFVNGTAKLNMTIPVDTPQLKRILAQCVARSGLENAYVEMIMTRGHSPTFSRDPREANNKLICFAIPFGWILPQARADEGLNVVISDITRIPPSSVDPRVKNYHWLDLVMGLYEAYDRDAETVILTDDGGNITEGPGFNVFGVRNGQIFTPSTGVLEGVSRKSAIELAAELGLPLSQDLISAVQLREADEVFATSTAGGIMLITRIDGVLVGNGGPGTVTQSLRDLYWQKHTDPAWSVAVNDLLND